jgi:trans-aconitate 2-methyltransferase
MSAWNPELYLRFKSERTQPSIDLVSRIGLDAPASIVDLGCGPGNSTAILAGRWPDSDILGLDYSEEMIAKARSDNPGMKWRVGEVSKLEGEYDLVFSNATLQWIPDHEALIPFLFSHVRDGGAFASQIPMFKTMELNKAIESVAARRRWRTATRGCAELFTYQGPDFYYRTLVGLSYKIDLWTTTYYHVLESLQALVDFCRSTGLKPYIERLASDADRVDFETELVTELSSRYAIQSDGKLLFPFERQFFVAYKK